MTELIRRSFFHMSFERLFTGIYFWAVFSVHSTQDSLFDAGGCDFRFLPSFFNTKSEKKTVVATTKS